jgi:hypothetical protein
MRKSRYSGERIICVLRQLLSPDPMILHLFSSMGLAIVLGQ